MARINKVQKYAALWLSSQGWDLTKIANELSLTNSQVKNVVENPEVTAAAAIKTVSSSMGTSPSKNLMINESPGKRSVSIMTKEASELNDVLKKKTTPPVSSKIQQGIFRPRP
jgi:plasmid maintenance system antidote protein VapI